MPDKQLDGIKPIKKDELDKSRRLILDTIGEPPKAEEKVEPKPNRMDSVVKTQVDEHKTIEQKNEIKPQSNNSASAPVSDISPAYKPKADSNVSEKKQAFLNTMKSATQKADQQKARQAEAAKAEAIKKQLEAEAQKKSRAEQENERLKNIQEKKLAEEKKMAAIKEKEKSEKEKKAASLAAKNKTRLDKLEYKRLKRAKFRLHIQRLKTGLIELVFKRFPLHVFNTLKLSIVVLFLAALSGIFLYSIFAAIVIKFDLKNDLARKISGYLPVPALISRAGIVDYYSYMNIKKSIAGCCETDEELEKQVKLKIARMIVVNRLADKYNIINFSDIDEKSLDKILENKIIYDNDINLAAISRIVDIKKKIDKDQNFPSIATKFGDMQGVFTLNSDTEKKFDFTAGLKKLNIGAVSNVIYGEDGYYIFKCKDKTAQSSEYDYLFIKAKTLDLFINESIGNYKFLSLVR